MNTNKQLNTLLKRIDILLEESILQVKPPQNISIAFSGGIDSSTIALKLLKMGFNPTLITTGSNLSKDKEFVTQFSQKYRLNLEFIHLSKKYVLSRIEAIQNLLIEKTPQKIKDWANKYRFHYENLPLYPNAMDIAIGICFSEIAKHSPDVYIFTGHGAGDIFGGAKKLLTMSVSELKSYLNSASLYLGLVDITRDTLITKQRSKILVNPLLSQKFIKFSKQIPAWYKVNYKTTPYQLKYVWTQYAKRLGVPDFVVNRSPKSMQYSCGIYNWVMKFLKRQYTTKTNYS